MVLALLFAAALGLLGLLAGIYVSTLIHDHRIADLGAREYVALHQMRDKTFRKVMPPMGLATLALVVLSTVFVLVPGQPRTLGSVAAALLLLDIALTVTRQVPLNVRIQNWTHTTIPDDWSRTRDQWARQHLVRTGLCLVAYACFLAAALLP